MPVTIRYATAKDALLIARISRQTFYETFASQNTQEDMDKFMNEQFTEELLIKEVGADHNIFLLAYEAEMPVGYARLRENNNPPELPVAKALEIARIYALGSSVGKGVGKALMQESLEIAREKGMQAIWLGVWEKNHRAIRFYEQWGYKKFAHHDFVLGNDVQKDWLMIKYL